MILVLFITIYPLYFVIIASISDPWAVTRGEVLIWPKGISFDGYSKIFEYDAIWLGYLNTIKYTSLGLIINLVVTLTCAYTLALKDLKGVRIVSLLIVFTMIFDGGMIPRFLIVKDLGIYNTIWAMVLPKAAWVYCIMVARTFIKESIPHELYEAGQIDGITFAKYFYMVVLPLSVPLISILILYYGVGHWNSYFDAIIYLRDREKHPLTLVLREILITTQRMSEMLPGDSPEAIEEAQRLAESIKYGVVIIASVPMLCLYPFLQKYFVKGVMIGAIKG
jgi:putative aldouronate transport system permease protein